MRWIFIITVAIGLYYLYKGRKEPVKNLEQRKFYQQWLKSNNYEKHATLLKQNGVKTLADLLTLDGQVLIRLSSDAHLHKLQSSVRDLQRLNTWLIDNKLSIYLNILIEHEIHSLEALFSVTNSKHSFWSSANGLKLQERILDLKQKSKVTRSFNLVTMFVLFLVFVFAGRRLFSLASSSNYLRLVKQELTRTHFDLRSLIVGNFLDLDATHVEWGWSDGQAVGGVFSFVLNFYRKNKQPFCLSSLEPVSIKIKFGDAESETEVPFSICQEEGLPKNKLKVSFTAHKSGNYLIWVGFNRRIMNSCPFKKHFQAGRVDLNNSKIKNTSSVISFMQLEPKVINCEMRDSFNNSIDYKIDSSDFCIVLKNAFTGQTSKPTLKLSSHSKTDHLIEFDFYEVGSYNVEFFYRDSPFNSNNDISLVILTEREKKRVEEILSDRSLFGQYVEARLLLPDNNHKKVFCYISSKFLTIKEFYLKVFPTKLFTFRISYSTKFRFDGVYERSRSLPILIINEFGHSPVRIASADCNVLLCCFLRRLHKKIGSDDFKQKAERFSQSLQDLHAKRSKLTKSLTIPRNTCLEHSMHLTRNFSKSDWRRPFEISFKDEEGLDWGGLGREWIEILTSQLFDPDKSGLFKRFTDHVQGLVHPNAERESYLGLCFYEFAGKIIGKCLFETSRGHAYKQLVHARFTRSFYAQLIGLTINYKYFEQDDPDFYKSKVKYILENNVSDMELDFTEEVYKNGTLIKVVDLIPDGCKMTVTEENKMQYLNSLAQYRLGTSVQAEIEALTRGLQTLVPDELLSMFDENELELLLCGTDKISMSEMRTHAVVTEPFLFNTNEFKRVMNWFWTIVHGFTREEHCRLLQFITGSSQLPPDGFSALHPPLQISCLGRPNGLPTAHTCFNQLCLPIYDSAEKLHQALLIAINEGNQGFGLI